MKHAIIAAAACVCCSGCEASGGASSPAAADAKVFLDNVNETMKRSASNRARPAGCSRPSSPTTPKRSPRARTRLAIDAGASFAKEAVKFDNGRGRRRPAASAESAEGRRSCIATPSDPKESEELTEDHGAARVGVRQRQVVPRPGEARHLQEHRRRHADHGDVRRRERAARGVGRVAHDFAADAQGLRSGSSSSRTRAPRSSASPTPARCGARSTTCRRTSSRRSSIGCGTRCGRSI